MMRKSCSDMPIIENGLYYRSQSWRWRLVRCWKSLRPCTFAIFSVLCNIIMFLNIQKIGKAKHKFKAKLTFTKLTNEATDKGKCFKVKIQRGAHQIEAVSEPSRKGTGKFVNTQYVIPMTLFCDESQKEIKYLEKQGIVKAYQCDEKGKQYRKIGEKKLDLSQFAKGGMLTLEIQMDPQKTVDSPVLILQIFLERQDDDSKSVETYSSNNDKRNDNDIEIERKPKDKKEQTKEKISKSPIKNEYKSRLAPIQQKQEAKPKKIEQDKRKLSYNKQEEVQSRKGSLLQAPQDSNLRKKKVNQPEKEKVKEQQSQSRQLKDFLSKKTQETELNGQQSPELQNFLLKKALKQKQAEASNFKRQNEILKKTIEKMVQESSTVKQVQKRAGFGKEIETMKKTLISKDIQIDKLTTENKSLTAREQGYQKTIIKLKQELTLTKEKICDMKYRQAYLMQEFFQTANKEALEEACRFLSI